MADTILAIKKQIESIVSESSQDEHQLLRLLKALADEAMTQELLRTTRIGLCVNTLRKENKSPSVQSAARELVKKWTSLADSKGPAASASPASTAGGTLPRSTSSSSTTTATTAAAAAAAATLSRSSSTATTPTTPAPSPSSSKSAPQTLDVRERCLETLLTAMEVYGKHPAQAEVVRDIEVLLYKRYLGEADPDDMERDASLAPKRRAYCDHIRKLASVLRNVETRDLRTSLLTGEMAAEHFVNMKNEDLMSKKLREESKQAMEKILNDKQLSKSQGTHTSSLSCGKCKGKDATYTQAQTRSADEPMTTFVVCNLCGHRWKFC